MIRFSVGKNQTLTKKIFTMDKPKFITHLEKTNSKCYSHLTCYETILIDKVDEKKLTLLWAHTEFDSNKLVILDRIYKTQHPFYIYIIRNKLNRTEGQVLIYYEAEQLNELIFFTKPFINSIKK